MPVLEQQRSRAGITSDPSIGGPRFALSPLEIKSLFLFLSHVDTSGRCWIWTGAINHGGYGLYSPPDGPQESAHRTSYRWFVDQLVPGMHIDHLCRTRNCVRPDHLEQVSPVENIRRASLLTHCHQGHPLSGPNLYLYEWRGQRRRYCRTCLSARMKRWRANRTKEE